MPADRRTGDAAGRIALVVSAAVSAALSWPAPISTTLTALAALAVSDVLIRRRRLGWEDAVMVGAAGLLIGLVLLGLVLNLLPPGLSRVPWAVGSGVLGVGAVVGARVGRLPEQAALPRPGRRAVLRGAPWFVAAAAVSIAAVWISVHATDIANRPPAQLSVLDRSPAAAVVQVQGGPSGGRYLLVVRSTAGGVRTVPVSLAGDGQARVRVALAQIGVTDVVLRLPGDRTVSDSLILRPSVEAGP